jgi:hypothetical protein
MQVELHTAQRKPPTVQAVLTSNGTGYRILCPHCYSIHVHGPQPGHKAAHCQPGTPGKELGYVLIGPAGERESLT